MRVIIEVNGNRYCIFRISERNSSGGLSFGHTLWRRDTPATDFHSTYPCNGNIHETVSFDLDGHHYQINYFPSFLQIKKDGAKVSEDRSDDRYRLIQSDFPFALPTQGGPRNAPSLYKLVNGDNSFPITNLFINFDLLDVFPVVTGKVKKKDYLTNLDNYLDKNVFLEVFISKDGVSPALFVEEISEKILDNNIPVIKARMLINLNIDQPT